VGQLREQVAAATGADASQVWVCTYDTIITKVFECLVVAAAAASIYSTSCIQKVGLHSCTALHTAHQHMLSVTPAILLLPLPLPLLLRTTS
jgi:hypothetical protein